MDVIVDKDILSDFEISQSYKNIYLFDIIFISFDI